MGVRKETRDAIIVMAAAALVIIGAFIGIGTASGVSPSQTIVESGSMQHGNVSMIGIIDTGDAVILKSKEKADIVSYIEGYDTGYETFGGYGSVIIYERGSTENPVIHRAILWLEYNEKTKTWSAPPLAKYPEDMWACSGGNDPYSLKGTLTLKGLGWRNNSGTSINLDDLANRFPHSGYLTMGDNNSAFDQPSNVMGVTGLITLEQIKSVAWIEIPWIGALKMWYSGETENLDRYAPNTIPCLIVAIISLISFAIGISFLADHIYYRRYRKKLHEEMNAPAP